MNRLHAIARGDIYNEIMGSEPVREDETPKAVRANATHAAGALRSPRRAACTAAVHEVHRHFCDHQDNCHAVVRGALRLRLVASVQ